MLSDRQFVVAVAILGLTAAAWPLTISALKWSQIKTPVAWPAGVEVSDDFRWTTLPARLGKYVLVDKRTNKQDPKTKAEGEIVLPGDVRDILGVGRYADAPRRANRASNWYISRRYENTSELPNSPLRFWQLDVTYYTGAAEKVEHVPGRCMLGAGFSYAGAEENVSLSSEGVSRDWETGLKFSRGRFVRTGKNPTPKGYEVVEYCTFMLNGKNESSWERVRWHMASTPWEKHCYFAKIMFAPMGLVTDVAACDREAQSFVNAFLPEVLRALPTSAKIVELNSGRSHKE
jgi:hypothetical protein